MKIVKSLAASLSMARWEKTPQVAWFWSTLWLVGLCGVAFIGRLGSIGLIDETEPLFAEAARLMTVTGDWITPYFDGDPRFDKPPLIYWLMAIAYKVLGVNEWAVRLPSAIAATVTVVGCFLMLRTFGQIPWRTSESGSLREPHSAPEATGNVSPPLEPGAIALSPPYWLAAWIGAAMVAFNPHMIAWGRSGVSDMLLVCCISVALMAFFVGYAQPVGGSAKPRWYLTFYSASALAVLAKGPIGVVLPGLIVGSFLLYMGSLRSVLKEMQLWRGLGIIVMLVLPWYAMITAIHGQDYIEDFFGYHNFERFTRVVNNHAAPWYFYVVVVLVGFMPWSLYLPLAIARLRFWRRRDWQQQPRAAQLGLFALFWFAGVFGFFTIAVTKLPSYMLPLIPAAAILVGIFWAGQIEPSRPSRSRVSFGESPFAWRVTAIANLALWAGLTWAALHSPQWLGTDPTMPDLPYVVVQSGILIRAAAVLIAISVAIAILIVRRQIRWVWVANTVGLLAVIVLVMMPASALIDSQRQLPLRQLAPSVVQYQQPNDEIIVIGFKQPSLVFYAERSVAYIRSPRRFIEFLRQSRRKQQPLPTSALLIGQADKLTELKLRLALPDDAVQILDRQGNYLLTRTDLSQMRLFKKGN